MNSSPNRSREEPRKSPQLELFEKLSSVRGVLRDLLIEITRSGVKKSVEDLEMDLLYLEFAEEFGIGKMVLQEGKNVDEESAKKKSRIQQLQREITILFQDFGKNKNWSKGQMSKARLLLYRVEEFISDI